MAQPAAQVHRRFDRGEPRVGDWIRTMSDPSIDDSVSAMAGLAVAAIRPLPAHLVQRVVLNTVAAMERERERSSTVR